MLTMIIRVAPPKQIGSNASSLTNEPEMFVLSKSVIKPDKETQLLQASTRWQKIKKRREEQVQQIKNYYEDQTKYQKMMHEVCEIENIEYKKQQALDLEDFDTAHKYAVRKEKMEKDYSDLSSRNFEEQGRKEWQQLISVLQQESQDAENMAECCQAVKEERQRRIAIFSADKERLYKETVEDMEQQRAGIENEKSELAFDLGMWNQNNADLEERMEEAVQEETERKKMLESKSTAIQLHIDELKRKLKQLESEQATVSGELKDVETSITIKLAVFAEEIDECNTEKKAIEVRQEELQHKLAFLEDQNAKIEKDMESQRATQQVDEQELRQLVTHMEQAKERAHTSKIEQSILSDLLDLMTTNRDQTVTQHEASIRRSRESITRKNHEIRLIQDKIYHCEQACIDLEEDTTKITSKLKSLDKLKKLAVQNGQFEKAGSVSIKINAAKSALTKLKESRDTQEDIKLAIEELKIAKGDLCVLEKDLGLIEDNRKLLLEKLKQQLNEKLQNTAFKTSDTVVTLLKYELKSIDTQLSNIRAM
ncbi:hypothetical protein [Parasitella parasitica]|uniref:Uncharacterized protein n=1 Tax=Parasitella parasitica TaxID=35722 RepID=A0A0B7MZD0_9FUNG|nr:hypothetical protein [Parasitella parasitica]